jgi:hypothetical protein
MKPFILHVQSFCSFDRAKFLSFLRSLRALKVRAVRISKETSGFGHVRSYRIVGRDDAMVAYNAAHRAHLLEWLS